MTLSQIIEEANRNLETERDELVKVAKAEKYQGTVEEIMEFLDQYDSHFQDTNVQVVKAALETFLRRLSPPALKLTLASMKRQVGLYLSPKDGSNGREQSKSPSIVGSIVSQDDIDALLNVPEDSEESNNETEEPGLSAAIPDTDLSSSSGENVEESTSAFDQSEIDALLGQIEGIGSKSGAKASATAEEEPSETPPDGSAASEETDIIVDQSAIDALLAGVPDSEKRKATLNRPSAAPAASRKSPADLGRPEEPPESEGGVISQSSIDDLLSQASEPETGIEAEPQAALDQSSVEALLEQIGTDSEPVLEGAPGETDMPSAAMDSADEPPEESSQAEEVATSEEGGVSQSSIDALFSQEQEQEKEIEAEAQAALDQSSVEALLEQIGTDSEPVAEMIPKETEAPSAAPDVSDEALEALSPSGQSPSSEDETVDQASVEELFLQEMETEAEIDAEAETTLDPSSVEALLAQMGSGSEPAAPETDEASAGFPPDSEVDEGVLATGDIPDAEIDEAEPATGEAGLSEEDSEETAASQPAEIPVEPDLAAGDVPLEFELPPMEPEPPQQRVVDAIVEATRRKVSSGASAADPDPGTSGGHIEGASAWSGDGNPPSKTSDVLSERVVEERGEAKILETFYRVYACVDGSYELLSESHSADEAKRGLMKAWMNHAGKDVVLKRVTRKEVLVIKEDLDDVPVRLEVTLDL